jgi:hypothetical protein
MPHSHLNPTHSFPSLPYPNTSSLRSPFLPHRLLPSLTIASNTSKPRLSATFPSSPVELGYRNTRFFEHKPCTTIPSHSSLSPFSLRVLPKSPKSTRTRKDLLQRLPFEVQLRVHQSPTQTLIQRQLLHSLTSSKPHSQRRTIFLLTHCTLVY